MAPSLRTYLENESKIIWYMAFFSGLTLLVVVLRIISRWMQWARLAWDDILLLAATAQMLAMNVLFVIATKRGGLGRHISDISSEQLLFFKKSYFAAGLVMPTCYATAKLSLLLLLHNIFALTTFRKVLRFLTIIVIFWWLGTILLDTFICLPIDSRWDPTVTANCTQKFVQIEYFATPIPWIITDFAILISPIPVLWNGIKTSRARQIGLTALFGFGIATCGVAVKRYITLLEIRNDDLTFSMVDPCVWTMIESSTTIICAAIPASTFVLRKLLPINLLGRIIEWFGDCINFSEDNATSTCEQIDTHVLEPPVDTASHEPTDQKSKISVV